MSLRVQLIHPPAFLNPTALTALRPSLPLGLAYIAAAIREGGHEVSLIDAVGAAPNRIIKDGEVARLGLRVDEIVERIAPQTQVIGLGAMFTYSWRVNLETIQAIKHERPDILLVGGGEHFTGLPIESLRDSDIDMLVVGEGEETMVELLDRYEAYLNRVGAARPENAGVGIDAWAEGLAGSVYRKDGTIHNEPRRNRIKNVDGIAEPAWDLFDVAVYDENRLVNGIKFGRTIPILATRGCPYSCNYCSSPQMWTTKWVPRDPVLVADEIEHYVQEFGASSFPFHDLTTMIRRDWIVKFAKEMIRRRLNVNWQLPTGTRCEVVDDEVAELLAQAGGRSMGFAPESGSTAVRKKIRKQLKEQPFFEAVKAAVRHRMNLSCFFVLGFPGDRVEDLRETLRWAARLGRMGVDDVAVGFYFPIPGTTFYRELVAEGKADLNASLLLAPIFGHNSHLKEKHNYSNSLSARTLTYWHYRIVWAFYWRAFFLNPRRSLRIFWNFVRGREDSKFDSFLQILKERFVTRRSKAPDRVKPEAQSPSSTETPARRPRTEPREPAHR